MFNMNIYMYIYIYIYIKFYLEFSFKNVMFDRCYPPTPPGVERVGVQLIQLALNLQLSTLIQSGQLDWIPATSHKSLDSTDTRI